MAAAASQSCSVLEVTHHLHLTGVIPNIVTHTFVNGHIVLNLRPVVNRHFATSECTALLSDGHVRFGSLATKKSDGRYAKNYVRFTPNSGH
jgi:hypothetical protein